MTSINTARQRRKRITFLSLGILAVVVFGCLNSIYIPRIYLISHQPLLGGFFDLNCPILLGKNEQASIRVSIRNPRDYSLRYEISLYQNTFTSKKVLLARSSTTVSAFGTGRIQFPIIGETTGSIELLVEAISSEDPVWLETGAENYLLPMWKSSFIWGCEIRSIGVRFPFNLTLKLAFWIAVFLCILIIGWLLAPLFKRFRQTLK